MRHYDFAGGADIGTSNHISRGIVFYQRIKFQKNKWSLKITVDRSVRNVLPQTQVYNWLQPNRDGLCKVYDHTDHI